MESPDTISLFTPRRFGYGRSQTYQTMPTLIFVHGTGVRESSFLKTFDSVRKNIQRRRPEISVVPCYWGEDLGVPFFRKMKSIPQYSSTGGAKPAADDDSEERWDLLREDPILELRMLAQRDNRTEKVPPGRMAPSVRIKDEINSLPDNSQVQSAVAELDLTRWLPAAIKTVQAFPDLGEAVKAANALAELGASPGDAARSRVARALVAALETEVLVEGELLPTPDERAKLVPVIFVALGGTPGQAKGFISDLFKTAFKPLAKLGHRGITRYVRTHRGSTTDALTPALGDILLYQARGEEIRKCISNRVAEAKPPTYILAHSLGGIASFELLVKEPALKLAGLITAGSQATFLYELDALGSLKAGEPLPQHFPRWLNFYDPNDILSYLAQPVFGNQVTDIDVQSHQPMLAAHSAYWADRSEKFWQGLLNFIQ